MANLEDLEKRIAKLEELNKNNLLMFGRSYSQYGNSNSDFLIKTKGQVKIQWGSKFIDLIKDGKINVESDFIYTANSIDNMGTNDGIYIINSDSIYLQLNGTKYPLLSETGNTYVSFLENQETDSNAKHNALINIGFICETLDLNALYNGIIYVESTLKLYVVKNGNISEFTVDIPNPYKSQFIIAKTDSNEGSIVIEGQGINNSLAFDTLHVYSESGSSYIESNGNLVFVVGLSLKITVTDNNVTFEDGIYANSILSLLATSDIGYRLYIINGESTLEVDNLIVRNGININSTTVSNLYNNYWFSNKNNIITKVEEISEYDSEECKNLISKINDKNSDNINYFALRLYLKYDTSIYKEKGLLMLSMNLEDSIVNFPAVIRIVENTSIVIEYLENYAISNADIYNIHDEISNLVGRIIFYISSLSSDSITIPKISNNGFDLIELDNTVELLSILDSKEEIDLSDIKKQAIKTRIGTLDNLLNDITGYGIYSKQIIGDNILTTSDLPDNDESYKLASTKWIRNYINNLKFISSDLVRSEVLDILKEKGLITE